MPLISQSTVDQVARDHLPRQVTADDASLHILYWEAPHVRSMLAADWPPPLPTDPTQAEIDAALALLAQQDADAQRDATQLRQQVLALAGSAVGVRTDQLTAAQVRALVALLLWKAGALDRTGAVRPLADWIGR